MDGEQPPNDMRNLWQSQKTEPIEMSLEQIYQRAQAYQRKIRWRNAREYVGAALVVIFFGYTIWTVPQPLMRVGPALCIAGALYVAYQLHKRGSSKPVPSDISCIDFHRRELSRQVELLRGVLWWYLGPLVPGLAVIIINSAISKPGHWRYSQLFVALYACFCALAFYFIWRLNQRAADRLQHMIDELDA